jgi:hypothetical protein
MLSQALQEERSKLCRKNLGGTKTQKKELIDFGVMRFFFLLKCLR